MSCARKDEGNQYVKERSAQFDNEAANGNLKSKAVDRCSSFLFPLADSLCLP